jgi:hypothetical protein
VKPGALGVVEELGPRVVEVKVTLGVTAGLVTDELPVGMTCVEVFVNVTLSVSLLVVVSGFFSVVVSSVAGAVSVAWTVVVVAAAPGPYPSR